MTDEEIIEAAQALYASDEVLVQEPGLGKPAYDIEQIVDRVDDGAWVLSWVWVPNVEASGIGEHLAESRAMEQWKEDKHG